MLLEPGDAVLVEEPSYLAALQAFQLAGAAVVPVPCDDDGLDPEAAAALAARHGARLLYTIPTFQNPTGRTLPLERREALVALARARRPLAARGRPLRRAALPRRAARRRWPRSRTACSRSRRSPRSPRPGLRIGWVRAPEALRRPLTIAKQAADLHTSTVDQAAAARWLAASTSTRTWPTLRARLRRAPRRAAGRAGRRAAARLDPQPPRRRHVRLGAAARRLGRRPRCSTRALEHDVAFVPGAVLRRPAGPRGAAALVHHAPAGGDRRGAAPPARRLGLGRAERVEVALQRAPHRLVDRQRERSASASRAGLACSARANRSARPVSTQNATSCAQWRRTRLGQGRRAGEPRVEQDRARAAGEADEPAGRRGAHGGLDAGAAQELDAERRHEERVAAAPVQHAVEAHQLGVRTLLGRDAQLVLEHRAEPMRAVGRRQRVDAEQPPRLVVEPRPGRGRVDRPELGGEREQELVGTGARAVGEVGEGDDRASIGLGESDRSSVLGDPNTCRAGSTHLAPMRSWSPRGPRGPRGGCGDRLRVADVRSGDSGAS